MAPQTFRTTRAGTLADFVGDDPNFREDKGFALNGWSLQGTRVYDLKPFYRGARLRRQVSPTTTQRVDTLIATALDLANPEHLRNWFANRCYCASQT